MKKANAKKVKHMEDYLSESEDEEHTLTTKAVDVKLKNVVYGILLATDETLTNWKLAYIGETGRDATIRDLEHASLTGGAGRVAASICKWTNAAHKTVIFCTVDDKKERKALETYLMLKNNTIVPNARGIRDRLAHENKGSDFYWPDVSLDNKPRNFQLNCKRETADEAAIAAAGKKYEKRAMSALVEYTAEDEQAMFESVDSCLVLTEFLTEPLSRDLVERDEENNKGEDDVIVFEIDSAFMQARHFRVKYGERNPSDVVGGDDLFNDVKKVQTFIVDESLKNRVKQMYIAIHPDKHASMPAGGVFHMFGMLEQLAGDVEEAAIVVDAKDDAPRLV